MAGLAQYDAIRQRLKSQFADQRQQQTDAIQRRFAANGMTGSGAFGKAQDQAALDVGKQEADATANLDFAEANEQQRQKEVGEGRAYQTSERLGSQQFATGEREAGQNFSRGMFNEDLGFKKQQFGEQQRQFDTEFAENQKTNRASLYGNLIGDEWDNPTKVSQLWSQIENVYSGKPMPKPQVAQGRMVPGIGGGYINGGFQRV